MSGTHKYPTISFRISPREREEIEAKIFASGMKKKDYFVRSCIYNRMCVVGNKETVYQIVERLQEMENRLLELAEQIDSKKPGITSEEIRDLQEAYEDMLKAILWMLDVASGMKKKDYFVRSCIYNRMCVVGNKETVYQIVERLQEMENRLLELAEQIDSKKPGITSEEIRDLQEAYEDMLKAILWMLDGAKYLWQGEEKSPDSGNC